MNSRYTWLLLVSFVGFFSSFSQEKNPNNYQQELTGSDLVIDMISIPKGGFRMGSPESEANRKTDEGPIHEVLIEAFWMSKYEVTWELYNLFVNRTIDSVPNASKGSNVNIALDALAGATIPYVDMSLGMGTEADLPVGNVTHHAASGFCKWLSAKTGYFYRLPTEAEWEYAARSGSSTAYHFGDDVTALDNYAWHYKNSNNTYHEVGQKKPNAWGLYDMHGNVAEWTLDQYLTDTYQKREKTSINPWEPATTEYPRTARGGSYDDDPEALRSATRIPSMERWKMRDPQFPKSKWWNTDAPFVGFRIVRQVAAPKPSEMKKYWNQKS
jgi:formylglycine-generating enzyme required for sulfatase activity